MTATIEIKLPDPREPWPSTKALSLYNVLVMRDTMCIGLNDALRYLRDKWDASYPQAWVNDGAQFLVECGFVELSDGVMTARHLRDYRPRRLVRFNNDRELRVADV